MVEVDSVQIGTETFIAVPVRSPTCVNCVGKVDPELCELLPDCSIQTVTHQSWVIWKKLH